MRATGVPRRPALMAQVQTDLTLALHTLPELQGNLKELLTYVRRLEAAVSFYAAPSTWDQDGVARHPGTLEEDRGETARMALFRHVNIFPFAYPFIPILFLLGL